MDRAALSGETYVVVVHGHGTGALRKRVRAHLDTSPYVARWKTRAVRSAAATGMRSRSAARIGAGAP